MMQFRHIGSAICAGVPALLYTVHASDDIDTDVRRVKISELSLYDIPKSKDRYVYEDEEDGSFREAVSSVRQSVWNFLDSIKDTTDMVKDKWSIAKGHSADLLDYIQNDPGVLPRATLITVAGLGGVIAGYKGGILRKAIYGSIAMTSAASLCYPKQAVEITSDMYDTAVDYTKEMWQNPKKKTSGAETKDHDKDEAAPVDKVDEKTEEIKQVYKSLADYGQSKSEDKDMYTTRS